jgi:hypothetical protein
LVEQLLDDTKQDVCVEAALMSLIQDDHLAHVRGRHTGSQAATTVSTQHRQHLGQVWLCTSTHTCGRGTLLSHPFC